VMPRIQYGQSNKFHKKVKKKIHKHQHMEEVVPKE